MNREYKPENHTSVSPYLVVPGANKMISMLKQVFGATEGRRYDNPNGSVMHAELHIDDSVVMIGDSSDEHRPNQSLIHVYVPDVDEAFSRALDAGCTSLEQPTAKEGDPDRRGMVRDFAGNVWAISTQKSGVGRGQE